MNIYVWKDLGDGYYAPTRIVACGKNKTEAVATVIKGKLNEEIREKKLDILWKDTLVALENLVGKSAEEIGKDAWFKDLYDRLNKFEPEVYLVDESFYFICEPVE